jgi:nitrogen PTS system EIIA component
MLLEQLFSIERIKVDVESLERRPLFSELVDFLALSTRRAIDPAAVLSALEEREAKMTTGIYPRVAIPHAKVAGIGGCYGVVGLSRSGVDYGSLDGKPVNLVFMLVSDAEEAAEHLKALKTLAARLDDALVEEMLGASGPAEVHAALASRG